MARVGVLGLLLATAFALTSAVGGRAITVSPPAVTLPAPLPSGLSSPLPSATPALTPTPAIASPTPVPTVAPTHSGGTSGSGAGTGGTAAGGGGGQPSTPAPVAATEQPLPLVHTVLGAVPSEVPVFPILLPLFAGLFLLLVSAVLAAYRRTQEAHRIARLERTKSDFLKLASHELRTPLTVLLGYVSMIRDGDVAPGSPAFDRALPIIEDRLNQVNTIVEQMLDAARLEDGQDRLELSRFDLADLVGGALPAFRTELGPDHRVEVRTGTSPLPLLADRGRVEAIVGQLLDNAIKYSPDGGQVEVSLSARQGRARLAVRDEGIGIASEDLERVFTRFGRLVTRDNSHIPGAGLGLYLARENARRMGGDITVVSKPNRGSTFTLSLPLAAEPAPAPAAPAQVQVES